MKEDKFLEELNNIIQILYLNNYNGDLDLILKRYELAKNIIQDKTITKRNPIKGSVRAYLEINSNYENPILDKMYDAEKKMELIVKNIIN